MLVLVFGVLFLLSIVLLFSQSMKFTGYATESNTTSNVTIASYFAIEMSANLSNGIEFGTVSVLPTADVNATDNNNSVNTTAGGATYNQSTSLWMNVSTDSNTAVDFCLRADALNTSAGDEITLANETWSNYSATNVTYPLNGSQTALTTSYAAAGNNVAVGGRNFYRFWLDVPPAIPTGTYNNTVWVKGVATGGGC